MLHPPGIPLLLFLSPVPQGSLNHEERDVFRAECSKVFISLHYVCLWVFIYSHLLHKEASLTMAEQDTDLLPWLEWPSHLYMFPSTQLLSLAS